MRRFSQRNAMVTLSDINITPLLDLAFVLLIIFVITTPMLEQGINLKLPAGGSPDTKKLDQSDIRTVEVSPRGQYQLLGRTGGWMELDILVRNLAGQARQNPRLLVFIRADENGPYKHVAALLNSLERAGIEQVSLRTEPPLRR
jgi:biopolymer transport protein ExbD